MTVIDISHCFLLVLASVRFEVLAHPTGDCHCYLCTFPNQTGDCLNATTCKSNDATTSSSSSDPLAFYSCDFNCSAVNTSDCVSSEVDVTSTSVDSSHTMVAIVCGSVGSSAFAVLVLILLLVCILRRREKRPKDPLKMLPNATEIDASVRGTAAIVPEGQVTSGHQSKVAGVSNAQQTIVGRSGITTSGLKSSQSFRQDKEDWTPPGISKSSPSSPEMSRPSPSAVATGKTNGRAARETQPMYTNAKSTREERDHSYINVEGLANDNDGDNSPDYVGNSPDYVDNCPDYVNTPSRNSADDDDLEYENVDVKVATAQLTTTSKTPMQRNSPPAAHQSKGLILTTPGKAVSSGWLASISGDRAAPMDPDYIDMSVKSELNTMFSPKSNNTKDTAVKGMVVSAPDVRMLGKNLQPVSPLYENQRPAGHIKPKTRTAQDLTTNNL